LSRIVLAALGQTQLARVSGIAIGMPGISIFCVISQNSPGSASAAAAPLHSNTPTSHLFMITSVSDFAIHPPQAQGHCIPFGSAFNQNHPRRRVSRLLHR
jgi:hypothetical protein